MQSLMGLRERREVAGRKAAMAYSSSGGGVGAKLKQIKTNTSHPPPDFHLKNTDCLPALLWHLIGDLFFQSAPSILLPARRSHPPRRSRSYSCTSEPCAYKEIPTVTVHSNNVMRTVTKIFSHGNTRVRHSTNVPPTLTPSATASRIVAGVWGASYVTFLPVQL